METINNVKKWFVKNNKTKLSDQKQNVLGLFTKAAFLLNDSKKDIGSFIYENESINVIESDLELSKIKFTAKEIRLLKEINNYYGYLDMKTLFKTEPLLKLKFENKKVELTDKIIIDLFGKTIKEMEEYFKNYDLNKEVIVNNDLVFFVQKDTNLTDEERDYLSKLTSDNQKIFEVSRTENGLVVF